MGAGLDGRHVVRRMLRSAAAVCVPLLVTACGAILSLEPLTFDEPPGTEGGPDAATTDTSYTLESTSRVPYFRADVGVSNGSFVGGQAHLLYDNVRIDYLP